MTKAKFSKCIIWRSFGKQHTEKINELQNGLRVMEIEFCLSYPCIIYLPPFSSCLLFDADEHTVLSGESINDLNIGVS